MARQYVRVRVRLDDRTRTVWAVKLSACKYLVADKYGDTETDAGIDEHGTPIERQEIIIAAPQDVLSERPARMSRTYAELEVVR